MIYWISGNTGSGKTSLSTLIRSGTDFTGTIDGDQFRETLNDFDMSMDGRKRVNLLAARAALEMARVSSLVVVSMIAPTEEIRSAIRSIIPQVRFIFLPGGSNDQRVSPYEVPTVEEWWI
jgi:adenylylsulfate kinase-like enzyme